MGLRFTSQLIIDNLPDEQLNDQFEVVMPTLALDSDETRGFWSKVTGMKYQPIVEEITFGHRNFTTDTRRVRTGWLNVPNDIENYHQVKITMFCPASMATQYYLEAWKRQIFNDEGEYYYPNSHYKKNIHVFIYGPGGTGVLGSALDSAAKLLSGSDTGLKCHYTLVGCFPCMEKDFEFKYTNDPERFRILATFSVDRVIVDTSSRLIRNAMNAELATSPTSVLGNLATAFGSTDSSNGGYNLGAAYGGKNLKSDLLSK